MFKRKSVVWMLVVRLLSLMVFFIMLSVLNFLTRFINHAIFKEIVLFLNTNVVIIVLITILLAIGDIFNRLVFPLNMPAPLLNSLGGVFLLTLLVSIFDLMYFISGLSVFRVHFLWNSFFYYLVFILVSFFGYASIFKRWAKSEDQGESFESFSWDDIFKKKKKEKKSKK